MSLQSPFTLWREGLRWGCKSFRHSPSTRLHGARLLACPVDLWRYREFRAVLAAYENQQRVLDVGSPKLLARLLATRNDVRVTAVDIAPSPEMVAVRVPGAQRAFPCLADGRSLPFPGECFDFVYSVSAIEHVGGEEGDTEFMEELARIMTPGATAVITTPLVPTYREIWFDHDPYGRQTRDVSGAAFFSRFYDWPSLQRRVIRPCGLRLMAVSVWQERKPGWYAAYCARTSSPRSLTSLMTKTLDPYWAHRKVVPVEKGPETLTNHGLAALVFRKG